jgi:hypothetical protein
MKFVVVAICLILVAVVLFAVLQLQKTGTSQAAVQNGVVSCLSSVNGDASIYSDRVDRIGSLDGQYSLQIQADGNLCLNGPKNSTLYQWCCMKYMWDPKSTFYRLTLSKDGNLCTYSSNGILGWTSNTANKGVGPFKLSVQTDRVAVLTDSKGAILWSSPTKL